MSDPWNAAWEEAEATAPPGVLVYATLELQHPAFIQGGVNVPIRVVTGVADDMSFGIEAGATFDGGTMQTFQAVPFFAERPEFAEGKAPECQVTVDNIGREIVGYLDAAIQVRADLIVLYREYRSDDLTEPCYGPIQFIMRKITVTGATVVGTANIDDLANRKFPYLNYDITHFPGLLPS
jgi:hypothetical protein